MWPRCCWSPEEYSLGVMPRPGGELARVREAAKVADLCDQPGRRPGRDATERDQREDLLAPGPRRGDLLEVAVEPRELAIEAFEVDEHLLERLLGERII
jgi:hypothetical protein